MAQAENDPPDRTKSKSENEIICPGCSARLSPSQRTCSTCGYRLDVGARNTEVDAGGADKSSNEPARSVAPNGADELNVEDLHAGNMIGTRYRIVARIGRGNMGEVYRADDLKLRQPVALKFLPERLAYDPARRKRFLEEVRIAREVSHPNVCRVHDIAEFQHLHFLTMEFVDGEDLASLLRRVGPLHGAKALELTRQLCAGLAAAHDKGVLHRDLKPANVMIDGRGRARITDFGLAVSSGDPTSYSDVSGTPAYMAPEQFAGAGASVQSDIYALGLVLYEIFTGQRAYTAQTLPELMWKKENKPPAAPSGLARGIDPIIEDLILLCLDKDPHRRPASVTEILAALPGGNPLHSILDSGTIPTPDMVAAAGDTTGMHPSRAGLWLSGIFASLLALLFLGNSTNWAARLAAETSPDVLKVRAEDIVRSLGYSETSVQAAMGFAADMQYLQYEESRKAEAGGTESAFRNRPGPVYFWYRRSSGFFANAAFAGGGCITEDQPAMGPGMIKLRLDPEGRLVSFSAAPSGISRAGNPQVDFDWSVLFTAAGLDSDRFAPTQPIRLPVVAIDAAKAWAGATREQPDVPLRIEAAIYGGRPVHFDLFNPGADPVPKGSDSSTAGERLGQVLAAILMLGLIVGAVLLARHNVRMGRGHLQGAYRIALFLIAVHMMRWLVGADHIPDMVEAGLLVLAAVEALFWGGLFFLAYMAFEPFVRRQWPKILVGWNAVLASRKVNISAGRELLAGILSGIVLLILQQSAVFVMLKRGFVPAPSSMDGWLSLRHIISHGFLGALESSIMSALFFVFLIFVLRVLVRRQWLAIGMFVSIFAVAAALTTKGDPGILLPLAAVTYVVLILVLFRFGLFSLVVAYFTQKLLDAAPLGMDFSSWQASVSLLVLVAVVAGAVFASRCATAGRRMLPGRMLEG